jgi:hypothetical protein
MGPVWHASAARYDGKRPRESALRQHAYDALIGVGDKSVEFHEFSGYAYHLRRRLTKEEELRVGCVIDLRNTEEALKRFEAIKASLPQQAIRLAMEEMGL